MSKLFFLSCNLSNHPYEVYPLGMAVIAQSMQKAGHQVSMYDCLVSGMDSRKLQNEVYRFNPDYICFSIRNLDDELDSWYVGDNTKKFKKLGTIVAQLKSVSSAQVIIGGAAVSLFAKALLEFTGADYAMIGEGENALHHLIKDLDNRQASHRIYDGRDYPVSDLEMCGALYDPELVNWYLDRSELMGLQTKRGCPFRCSYCVYPALEGNIFRYREVEEVIDEIRYLKKEYGCRNFFFTDSVFNDPQGQYKELVQAFLKENLDIQWSAYFTPYCLVRGDIELCKLAGLKSIELGTDASSSTTLSGLNKLYNWEDVVRVNEFISELDIECAHFIIFGGPNETYKTIEEGIENCIQLSKCLVFGYAGIRIYPDAAIYHRALREGIVNPQSNLLESVYYFSPEIKKDEMNKLITAGWSKRKNLIFPPEKARQTTQSLKKFFGFKGSLWNHLYRYLYHDSRLVKNNEHKNTCFNPDIQSL